jgi:hypothetical protein
VYDAAYAQQQPLDVPAAGICGMFERDLKERFSHQRELTYDVQQLFQWMDHLVSLSFGSNTVSSALPWLHSSSAVFLRAEVPLSKRPSQPHEQFADKITFVCAA